MTLIYSLPVSVKSKYVLYVLRERYQGEEFTVSHLQLCDMCNASKTTLLRCLTELEEMGYMKITRTQGTAKNVYQVLV